MARQWIVVGDTTDSGGRVLTGSSYARIEGSAVACVGDRVSCRLHAGVFPIVAGNDGTFVAGAAIACHGDTLECGCTLISRRQSIVYADRLTQATHQPHTTYDQWCADTVPVIAFDQAIQFLGATGTPLGNVAYCLTLADGSSHHGVTDSAGVSKRVNTQESVKITSATLSAPEDTCSTCHSANALKETVETVLEGVATTRYGVGSSIKIVRHQAVKRGLTSGELAMSRLIFGDAIDYSTVFIHNHGYWMFFGFQQKRTAVTPNGQMYFPEDIYEPDYSRTNPRSNALFIHEMCHVWQYQLGYYLKLTRAPRPGMSYEYSLSGACDISEFNMEAQASLISDYFLLLQMPYWNAQKFSRTMGRYRFKDYDLVLRAFLKNPFNRALLLGTTR